MTLNKIQERARQIDEQLMDEKQTRVSVYICHAETCRIDPCWCKPEFVAVSAELETEGQFWLM